MDKFLGGAFLTYGSEVLKFSSMDQENRSDPMIEVGIQPFKYELQLAKSGKSPFSDLPPRDQVYIPQVRSFRQHPEARCPLRSGVEHPEREDLHLPMVRSHPMVDSTLI